MKAKVFSILALLLTVATGAQAQSTYTVTVKDGTEDAANWSATPNPATAGQTVTIKYNGTKKVKSVKAVKKPVATVATAPTTTTGNIVAGSTTALITAGTAEGGTMMYKVTNENTQPASTEGFSTTVPTAASLAVGTYYVWYYVQADDTHTDSEIAGPVTVTTLTPQPFTFVGQNVTTGTVVTVSHGYNTTNYTSDCTYDGLSFSAGTNPFGGGSNHAITITKSDNNVVIKVQWTSTAYRTITINTSTGNYTNVATGAAVTTNRIKFNGVSVNGVALSLTEN